MKKGITYLYLCIINIRKVWGISVEKSDSIIDKMILLGAISQLPQNLIDSLKRKDISFWYQKEIIYPKAKQDYQGFYDTKEGLIGIKKQGFQRDIHNLYHEIGHYVDFEVGQKSFNSAICSTFFDYYVMEKDYFEYYPAGFHYQEFIHEYYAESFALLIEKDEIDVLSPNTVSYINRDIQNV